MRGEQNSQVELLTTTSPSIGRPPIPPERLLKAQLLF
jgi:hypothetical protein